MQKAKKYPLPIKEIKDQLTKNAPTIFEEALKNKSISTDQVSQLIHPKYRSGRKFTTAMDLLTNVFTSQGIFVTYTPSKKEVINKLRQKEPARDQMPVIYLPLRKKLKRQNEGESVDINELEKVFSLHFENNAKEIHPDKLVPEEDWYLDSLIGYKVLSKGSTYQLINEAQKGNIKARNLLVMHNLKLVVHIVRKHFRRVFMETGSIEFNDLFQEGTLGLCRAIEKFDISLDMNLSTYAYWWIYSSVQRALVDYQLNIRLPAHIHEKLMRFRKIYSLIEIRAEQKPDMVQIAEEIKISTEEAYKLEALNKTRGTTSLDTHLDISDEEDTRTFEEILTEKGVPLPSTLIDQKILKDKMRKCLKFNLTMKEYTIINLRFGLSDNKPLTLEQIGEEFDVTRERIRQLEVKALDRIKNDNALRAYAAEYLGMDIPEIKSSLPENVEDWRTLKVQHDYSLISRVVQITSKYYAVPTHRILTEARKEEYVHARHVTIYILVDHYRIHFSEIQRKFNVDNETIKNVYFNLKKKLQKGGSLEKEIEFIIDLLNTRY